MDGQCHPRVGDRFPVPAKRWRPTGRIADEVRSLHGARPIRFRMPSVLTDEGPDAPDGSPEDRKSSIARLQEHDFRNQRRSLRRCSDMSLPSDYRRWTGCRAHGLHAHGSRRRSGDGSRPRRRTGHSWPNRRAQARAKRTASRPWQCRQRESTRAVAGRITDLLEIATENSDLPANHRKALATSGLTTRSTGDWRRTVSPCGRDTR